MTEYIEREAISEEIRKYYYKEIRKYYYKNPLNSSYEEGFDRGLDRAQRAILDAPAADVAPVRHGRWLYVDTDTEQFFLCNRCKEKEYLESNYCPNCGAKMNEEVTYNG